MSLTTRLTLFFLGPLAVVLIGFSATVYLLAQTYLNRQVEDRLEGALNVLAAAAESEPGGLEWEPHERHLYLDHDLGDGPLPWVVIDGDGKWVDGSKHYFPDKTQTDSPLFLAAGQSKQKSSWRDQLWLVSQRCLESKKVVAPSPPEPGQPKQLYPALVITCGVSLASVDTALRNLAMTLLAVSSGIWLLALFAGRWFCRRALLPVTRMAATARKMDATELGQRLPMPNTGDEVADLGLAFNDLLARLHESFERQQRFTGDASHQLRTPLTAILGQIEVALRRDRSPDEYQRTLTSVQGQAQHLRQIVEMLLFLARADAEVKLPNLETIQWAEWIQEHLQQWSGHDRFADLRLESTSDITLQAKAQAPLLGQLVDNLLDNACKYSQPGTPIIFRVGADKDSVFLVVQDAGCGIAPTDLSHVFEPFFRSSQARQQGFSGIGLGLAIAERIANAFQGHITAVSEPGKGSNFTLRLPQARQEGQNDSMHNPHNQPQDAAPDCKR